MFETKVTDVVFTKVYCVPCRLTMAVSKFPVRCPLCRCEYVTTTGEELSIVRENSVPDVGMKSAL